MTDVPSVNFDRAAGFYDVTRPVDDTELTQTLALLHRTLNPSGPTLEIGVGTGALALPLAERGWHVTGVDISAAMISKLVEKVGGAPPLALVRADATVLPFADASFGGAYVRHVFHLIPRWRDVVAELCRVTERQRGDRPRNGPRPLARPLVRDESGDGTRSRPCRSGLRRWWRRAASRSLHRTGCGARGGSDDRPSDTRDGGRVLGRRAGPHPFLDLARSPGAARRGARRREAMDRRALRSTDIRLEERIRQRWWVFDVS